MATRTVYTDASVRFRRAGFAVVSNGRVSCGCAPVASAYAAELMAVVAAVKAYPAGDVEIVCDNDDVRNGINGRRYRPSYEPHEHADLWAAFDRAAVGRTVTTRYPAEKNRGFHGLAHRMARVVAKHGPRRMRAALAAAIGDTGKDTQRTVL